MTPHLWAHMLQDQGRRKTVSPNILHCNKSKRSKETSSFPKYWSSFGYVFLKFCSFSLCKKVELWGKGFFVAGSPPLPWKGERACHESYPATQATYSLTKHPCIIIKGTIWTHEMLIRGLQSQQFAVCLLRGRSGEKKSREGVFPSTERVGVSIITRATKVDLPPLLDLPWQL